MAVYTPLSHDELQALVTQYGLGELLSSQGISEGVENTNYLLKTLAPGHTPLNTILTLYEKRVRTEDLPFYLGLMHHLAGKGLSCPLPLERTEGGYLADVKGKKCAIISFLAGHSVAHATLPQLHQAGAYLARMHLATADFSMTRSNDLSFSGWQTLAAKVHGKTSEISPQLDSVIADEIAYLEQHWPTNLPTGTLHADYFPDNVFFVETELSGVIDFYFACTDMLAYDLAIAICAWCFDTFDTINEAKKQAMIEGYHSIRPLSEAETSALPTLLRGSALRFLLTRTHDRIFHPEGAFVTPKDPMEYVQKLSFFQQAAA